MLASTTANRQVYAKSGLRLFAMASNHDSLKVKGVMLENAV